jgi:hypothetical protein
MCCSVIGWLRPVLFCGWLAQAALMHGQKATMLHIQEQHKANSLMLLEVSTPSDRESPPLVPGIHPL